MSEEPGIRVLIDRYRLITSLGPHLMRGWDTHLREVVAVRMFPPPTGSDQVVERASVLADLTHPGIVRVLDAGNADGEPFLVVEFIAGTPLSTRLADGPLPANTVGQMGVALARALAYAHLHGVEHRDVRPGNILLGPADEPYLTDLGIAESTTPSYMAPEQIDGAPPGPATDVYALGLVLLESLTGQKEYPGSDAASIRARLTHPPRVSPDLQFAAAIEAMTATNPAERPDAATCADLLRGSSAKSRMQTRTVLIAAVSAAVVAMGAMFAFSTPRPTAEPRAAIGPELTVPPPRLPPRQIAPEETGAQQTVPEDFVVTTSQPPSSTTISPAPPVDLAPLQLPVMLMPPDDPAADTWPTWDPWPPNVEPPPWYRPIHLPGKPKKPKKNQSTTTTTSTTPASADDDEEDEEDE